MFEKLIDNLIDSFSSVMPIAIFVFVVGIFIGIDPNILIAFTISISLLIFGMTLFQAGADISMIPIGENIGRSLIKGGKKWIILFVALVLGTVITIAEPDLMVLARQLSSIPKALIIAVVAGGLGLFLAIAVLRLLKGDKYQTYVNVMILFMLACLAISGAEFIPLAFESGGVTTGPMGVPLLVAFGSGLCLSKSDSDSDCFGLCGLGSIGPIVLMLLVGLFFSAGSEFDVTQYTEASNLAITFSNAVSGSFIEVMKSVTPIVGIFVLYQLITKKFTKQDILKICLGLIVTIIGLTIFLTGVSAGFLKLGFQIGSIIAVSSYKILLIPIGMILGYIIITAEPAIKILLDQISDLTHGSISKKILNLCLSIGVSLAIGLAIMRIYFDIPFVYIMVPGYLIAALLSFKCPNMFCAIAFDSGGAASGPLSSSFLLPLCIGACYAQGGNVISEALGVVGLVSLIPIITIQAVGLIYQRKMERQYIDEEYNEEIIDYEWE